MKRPVCILLIIVAVVCFGAALSYPILYNSRKRENDDLQEQLTSLREEALGGSAHADGLNTEQDSPDGQSVRTVSDGANAGTPDSAAGTGADAGAAGAAAGTGANTGITAGTGANAGTAAGTGADAGAAGTVDGSSGSGTFLPASGAAADQAAKDAEEESAVREDGGLNYDKLAFEDLLLDYVPGMKWRQVTIPEYEEPSAPVLLKGSVTAKNRNAREGALPYPLKKKEKPDDSAILPELQDIHDINPDLIGWIRIEGTDIDYPVVQTADSEFYLTHDFYGRENNNGSVILDSKCDVYTPSYNLVISGHHMRSGAMFGRLPEYQDENYWREHRFVEFDSLYDRNQYVVMAAFYSADYDEDEEGFRYNADIQYKIDADQWLEEIREEQLYDTGIDAEFGDEFITLTTCERSRHKEGRFVLILRKLREGETVE